MILGIIGFILNLLSIYCWFSGNYVFAYIGGLFTLAVNIIGLYEGTNRTVFYSLVLPSVIGLLFFQQSLLGACMGISLVSAIFFILGTLLMVVTGVSLNKNNKIDSEKKDSIIKEETFDESLEGFECSNCGSKVKEDATECPKCGAIFIEDDDNINNIGRSSVSYNKNKKASNNTNKGNIKNNSINNHKSKEKRLEKKKIKKN